MNDFTKEELSLLRTCLTKILNNVHYPLEDKLTSMIDNYCDHENSKRIDGFVRDPTDYTECNHEWDKLEIKQPAVPTIICIKCRAIHFERIKD
jgi:hypothetical protein